MAKHFLLILSQVGFALLVLVHSQTSEGFISIDCGLDEPSYRDLVTGLSYTSDANFTDGGISKKLSSNYSPLDQQLKDVRSFPNGIKNCYTLRPSQGKSHYYLIRARFLYGNYDSESRIPEFDLYLGVNFWFTVKLESKDSILTKEIIYFPRVDYIYVCLVNTGSGTPFISALELRPLNNFSYNAAPKALDLEWRLDCNLKDSEIRAGDEFDRIWKPLNDIRWVNISTNSTFNSSNQNNFYVPSKVMQTAIVPADNKSGSLGLYWTPENTTATYYFYFHFAEIQSLKSNQTRNFSIYINSRPWYLNFKPRFMSMTTIYNVEPEGPFDNVEFRLNKTANSTLPPLLNAMEGYRALDMLNPQTDQKDVDAITNIKSVYAVKKNWVADPCAPKAFSWEGLDCNYSDPNPPTIIGLDLSLSGLTGQIAPSISNLLMLQTLDLSNNSLQGTVPGFLSQLQFLKVLNLEGNNLSGFVPMLLVERSKNGTLSLKASGNPHLCLSDPCENKDSSNNSSKNLVVPIVASVCGFVLLSLTITVVIIWNNRRKKQVTNVAQTSKNAGSNEDHRSNDQTKEKLYTYSEILSITNNFEQVLGKGGFGTVYLGNLDGTQVAVKVLSSLAAQGYRQFQAEVQLLMKVHHKNLTSLIGYCNDGTNIALIYECMAKGDLATHLFDKTERLMSWEERLHIVVDAAQGLEYLHDGCKPPITHRDIKCTNILLNEKYQAKLSDFGLSRVFPEDGSTYVTTVVAGTPGYFDPEFQMSARLNEKSDVYSFGVVLLEIITGRPAISRDKENAHVSQWVSFMLTKGDVKSIVDPKLDGDYNINSVWKALEVAMDCVSHASVQRPTMNRVVTELKECLAMEMARTRESHNNSGETSEMLSMKIQFGQSPPQR